MSSSLAFRIDALHGPSWQIAHAASLVFNRRRPNRVIGFSGQTIVVSRPKAPHIEVYLPICGNRSQSANAEWPGLASAALDRKLPDVYSIGHHRMTAEPGVLR